MNRPLAARGRILDARWVIEEPIERGATAQVWAGHDPHGAGPVAIKILDPTAAADPELRTRFEREAAALRRIDHEHVVKVHASGSDGETPYIVMDLIAGQTLADLIAAQAPLAPS